MPAAKVPCPGCRWYALSGPLRQGSVSSGRRPYCLAGVSRSNGLPLPWPGEVFRRLLAEWGRQLELDIRGQILGEIVA